jgi:hypothetical protein
MTSMRSLSVLRDLGVLTSLSVQYPAGKVVQVLETRPSSSGSAVPDTVDPDDEELGGLYLVSIIILRRIRETKDTDTQKS